MPIISLSALFRGDAGRSNGLPHHLPAPGSAEAKAAFRDACHEHTVRTRFADEYPELQRTPLEWWTAESLGKAMEAGEITPAACARLCPLATERELRMAQIEHDLNIRALFALAYANEYPVEVAEPVRDALTTTSDVLAFKPRASASQR